MHKRFEKWPGSFAFLTASLGFFLLTCGITAGAEPEEVKFTSDKLILHGFLYKPEGNGPFPAILYNHGSESNPGTKPELGKFFSARAMYFSSRIGVTTAGRRMILISSHCTLTGRARS
jgi:hypothetical protein